MAHIVIIGAGIGGMPAAQEMRSLLPKEHRITVVNPVDGAARPETFFIAFLLQENSHDR